MVIQKAGRGRPSRRFILEQVDLGMQDLARIGGLPSPVESVAIWRDIWFEEAHNSTAIEGNTLALKQVKVLLEEGRSVGNKELREYLEVKAYASAAEWVYAQGRTPEYRSADDLINLTEVRHIHRLTVAPVWEFFPPEHLDPDEGPGSFRRHDIAPFPGGMQPPPFTDVPARMTDWLQLVNTGQQPETHALVRLAAAPLRIRGAAPISGREWSHRPAAPESGSSSVRAIHRRSSAIVLEPPTLPASDVPTLAMPGHSPRSSLGPSRRASTASCYRAWRGRSSYCL